ncbi:MAG: hypothetical protein ACHQIO_05240 [Nevskiales bacterium]
MQAAGGDGMKREDAQRVLDFVDSRAERLARERGLSPDEAVRTAAREAVDGAAAAAAIERRNALLNLQKRMARRERIEDTAGAVTRAGKPADLALAVRNQVVAINTPTQGGRFSAEAYAKTRAAQYVGAAVTDLQRAGLLKVARNGTLEREWTRELYELSLRDAGEPSNPGVTGSREAQQIAAIFHKYQALARDRLNREGAWIGNYAGYITRTSHDPDLIRRAGFDAWHDAIAPGLDPRTFEGDTFAGPEDQRQFLRSTFNALVTGVHLSDEGGVGFKDPAFTGPVNMARSASEGRVLHFRDADAWLDYQKRFGSGTVLEQVLNSYQRAARQEALLQRWGTNPQAEFDQDIRWLKETYRDRDPEAVARLGQAEVGLAARFNYLTGEATRPVNRLGAQIGSDIRVVESMAKLGLVAFTHLSSAVTKAAELRYQGIGLFDRYANFIDSMMQGRGRGEMRELADLLLAGTEGMHGNILSRFTLDDTVPGTLSKLTNRFFQASGLTWLLNAQKAGAERIMSRHLGMQVEKDFAGLPAELQRALMQYDISPADWDALRTAPGHFTVDGRVFLTPDAAQRAVPRLDLAGSDILTSTQRDALALKLHAYLADVADRSIITPGIETRALLTGGNRPGTFWGELARFIAQFKTWGVAAMQQGVGREINGGQGLAGAISGVVQMALAASLLGYATMTLKDLVKGLTPRQPNDARTWTAALIQGGGFGILGDYLFGEYSRFGGGIGESVLGPVLGQGLTEIMTLWNDLKDGRGKDIPPDTARIILGNTPFINMFYSRAALNYLFLNSIQETLNPGYLRRSEQRVRQQTGQTFWLSPQQHLHTFGR